MKLIDILVRELPKRGGWPEDSSEMFQSGVDSEIYTNSEILNDFYVSEIASERGVGVSATREQYEDALAARSLGWDGTGLPPAGCECEVELPQGWVSCKIKYSSECVIVYDPCDGCGEFASSTMAYRLRPLRTEADKKRDSALLAMNIAANEGESGICGGLVAIYDSIAAGKIPGVKLED